MTEQQVDQALVRADRWSKILALFFAIGLYLFASLLVDNTRFNASVAAFGGVGMRIYIPYHASISGDGSETLPSQAYDETGNYHHGAGGSALVVGSFAAIGCMVMVSNYNVAIAVGVGTTVISYLILRSVLPSK